MKSKPTAFQCHSTKLYPMFGLPSLSNTKCLPSMSTDVFFKARNSYKRIFYLLCHLSKNIFNSNPLQSLLKKVHLPGIDFGFRSQHTVHWIASQHVVQCLRHTVDGSIHTKSCALHCRLCHQANISRWQVPTLWAGIYGTVRCWHWRWCKYILLTQFD